MMYAVPGEILGGIADAIRSKTGSDEQMTVSAMAEKIGGIGGDVPFEYGGFNAELIDDYTETWTLDDTSFVKGASSYPTSATTIKPAVTRKFIGQSYPYGEDDIVVIQTTIVNVEHDSTAENRSKFMRCATQNFSYMSKRLQSIDMYPDEIRSSSNSISATIEKYYNDDGLLTSSSTIYSFTMPVTNPDVANRTAESTTVRCNSPQIMYRVYSGHESQENMAKVIGATFSWNIKVYKVKARSTAISKAFSEVDRIILA